MKHNIRIMMSGLLVSLTAVVMFGCATPVRLNVMSDGAEEVSIGVSPSDMIWRKGGSTAFQRLYKPGTAVTLEAPILPDYRFNGWTHSTVNGPIVTVMVSGDMDMTASYTLITTTSVETSSSTSTTSTETSSSTSSSSTTTTSTTTTTAYQPIVYIPGDTRDKGQDIWTPSFNGMDIRVGANDVVNLNRNGIPAKGSWYGLDKAVVPAGSVVWTSAPDGGIIGKAVDFTSTRTGLRYHFCGWLVQVSTGPLIKTNEIEIPKKDCSKTLRALYATVAR